MASVSVRYIVNDVAAAIAFYCDQLDFRQVMHPAPTFAMLDRGELRLVLGVSGMLVLFYVLVGGPVSTFANAAAKTFF